MTYWRHLPLTFVDVSKLNKKDPEEKEDDTALVKGFSEVLRQVPVAQLKQDEIYVLKRPAIQSQGIADGTAVLFHPALSRTVNESSILCDLDKYTLGFQQSLNQMCFRFKQEKELPSFLANSSYSDWLSNEIITCLLQGLQHQTESSSFTLSSEEILALQRGPGSSLDEITHYATGLSSILLATSQEKSEASKKRMYERLLYQMGYTFRDQVLANTNAQSSIFPAVLAFASKMAHEIVDSGSKDGTVRRMVRQYESESQQELAEKEKRESRLVIEWVEKEDNLGRFTAASPPMVSMPSTQLLQVEDLGPKMQVPYASFINTLLRCLSLEFSASPDGNMLVSKRAWPGEDIGFCMTDSDYASLLSWGVIKYSSQIASNFVDSIMKTLIFPMQSRPGSEVIPELDGQSEAAAIYQEREEVAKLFLMLYADRLCFQILTKVIGPMSLKYQEPTRKSLSMLKDVINVPLNKDEVINVPLKEEVINVPLKEEVINALASKEEAIYTKSSTEVSINTLSSTEESINTLSSMEEAISILSSTESKINVLESKETFIDVLASTETFINVLVPEEEVINVLATEEEVSIYSPAGHITSLEVQDSDGLEENLLHPERYQEPAKPQLPESPETQPLEFPSTHSMVPIEEAPILEQTTNITPTTMTEDIKAADKQPMPIPEANMASMQASMYEFIQLLIQTILQDALLSSESSEASGMHLSKEGIKAFDTCDACLDIKWYYSTISEAVAEYRGNDARGLAEIIAKKIGPEGVKHLVNNLTPTGQRQPVHAGYCHRSWTGHIVATQPMAEVPPIKVTNLKPSEDQYTRQLQAILEWSVASQLGVPEMILVEEDVEILYKLQALAMMVEENGLCVGDILRAVFRYQREVLPLESIPEQQLLDWLLTNL
ncbi:uncharacterized protein LOC142472253 isoform X2 [Ascaphus truei]|uniref:uncharacterized protein LOC142472253 isoform X2 n=1 Tax=Ascaphus truei TaxID=8439 RepID=UPI003F5AAAC7